MIVITIANQKGGTGKTSVAAHLAHGLALDGRQILALDLDTQGQLGLFLGTGGAPGVSSWLLGKAVNGHARMARENLALIPGDKSTGPAVTNLLLQHDGQLPVDLITSRLERLAGVDYVILDTSPAATQLQAAALLSADLIVLPAVCDYVSPVSVRDMVDTLGVLYGEQHKPPAYILPTFYDARTTASGEALAHYRRTYGGAVLPPIHRATSIAQAAGQGLTVFETAPRSRAADEFRTIVHIIATTEV